MNELVFVVTVYQNVKRVNLNKDNWSFFMANANSGVKDVGVWDLEEEAWSLKRPIPNLKRIIESTYYDSIISH